MAKEAFAGTGITVLTTGSGRLFSTLDHYLVMSQLSSFGTAFFTVFGVIFLVFRSLRFGAADDRARTCCRCWRCSASWVTWTSR